MYNYIAIASYSKLARVGTNYFLIMCVGCAWNSHRIHMEWRIHTEFWNRMEWNSHRILIKLFNFIVPYLIATKLAN